MGCHFLLQGISQTRDRTWVSHIAGGFFPNWATRENPIISGTDNNKSNHIMFIECLFCDRHVSEHFLFRSSKIPYGVDIIIITVVSQRRNWRIRNIKVPFKVTWLLRASRARVWLHLGQIYNTNSYRPDNTSIPWCPFGPVLLVSLIWESCSVSILKCAVSALSCTYIVSAACCPWSQVL